MNLVNGEREAHQKWGSRRVGVRIKESFETPIRGDTVDSWIKQRAMGDKSLVRIVRDALTVTR